MIRVCLPEVKNRLIGKTFPARAEITFAKGEGDVVYSLFFRSAPGGPFNEDPLEAEMERSCSK
jgi:hypothetical protein